MPELPVRTDGGSLCRCMWLRLLRMLGLIMNKDRDDKEPDSMSVVVNLATMFIVLVVALAVLIGV